jgi:MFS family permease
MVLGSFGMALGLSLPVVMPSMTSLYLSAAAIGMSNIFFHVATHNLVGSLGDSHDRTSNFGTFSLGAAIAGFLGPMLTGLSIDQIGHVPTYACLAIVAGIPGVVLLCYASFIPPHIKVKHEEQTRGIRELLGTPALRRTLITSGLILTGIDLFNFYMPIYGRSVGLSASVIGAIMGAYAAAAFVVRLQMPRLARRFGEERILAGSLVMAGVTYFLFPLFQHPIVLAAISFFLGLGLGCGQPLSIILTYNHAPAGRAGEALGMRLTVNKFTQILVPVVFGSLGTLGVYPVFWANAVFLLMSGYVNTRRDR